MINHSTWIAQQDWEHILFLHWSFPPEMIAPYIEEPFELQTFNSKAWITLVLFQATNSKFRYLPEWTSYPPLTQINARTYVKLNELNKTGVYFFSLNVNSILGALGANLFYGLPFNLFKTTFNYEKYPYSIYYDIHSKKQRLLSVYYQKHHNHTSDKRNLTHFLTERYCILTRKGEKIIKIPLTHSSWDVKSVEAQLYMNDHITNNFDTFLPAQLREYCTKYSFIAHYCRFKQTKLHPYKTIGLFK